MKHDVSKKLISLLLACVMLMGLIPATALTAYAATNVSGNYYASNFVDGDDLVLIGDTTIFVNADLTLRSISGEYALEIQSDGEHTLTIDNPNGCAIDVNILKSVKPSQGTVNLTVKGGAGYYAIAATGDISLDGINLDAKGSAGIRSTEGNVTINGTNISIVGDDGVGVIANSGSIYIDSDYLFVQCASQSGDAEWEYGICAETDVTIISDDATIAGSHGVSSRTGNITLNGNFAVGGQKSAVVAPEGAITMTGAVTAQGGDGHYAIAAKGVVSFEGTKLDVKGSSGIRSIGGNVTIDANSTSIVGQNGVGIISESARIIIFSDYLFVQCVGVSDDVLWKHGIYALKDISIFSDDATIVGQCGIQSDEGEIYLLGTFWVGATDSAILAQKGAVSLNGCVTAQGGNGHFAIEGKGDISVTGEKLDAKGGSGIRSSDGDVLITADSASVVGQNGVGIISNSGSVDIESAYLFVQCMGQSGDALWKHGIGAVKDITVISNDATIAGLYGIASDEGCISLSGTFWVGARKSAIYAQNGSITVDGDLTANNTEADYSCIISHEGDISLSDGTINVTSTGNAVITNSGNIYLNGDVSVNSAETDSYAIHARYGDIVIQGGSLDAVTGGTYAMYAYRGNIGMNQPLSLIVPEDGRIDTDTIVDANGDPASHVEIATVIEDEISVWINEPVGGEKPASASGDVYGLNSNCTVKSITWYENGAMFNGGTFTAGKSYKVEIILSAKTGYVFQAGVSGHINGKTASTATSNGRKEMILTYSFGSCPAVIRNVALSVTAPSDGKTISYSVTDEGTGYSVPGNSNYVSWYVSDNGIDYTLMTSGDKFVGGKYYKVEMEVLTHTGYEFALKDVGTIQPDVSATVNGYKATVVKTYDQDPSENITVQYSFGLCNDTIIENITIVDVPKPVPGEKPVYTVAVSGSGYHIADKNTSEEVYEGGKYVDKYFIRSGIGWYDATADNWIYETDTFIAGHDYQAWVYLVTDDGYRFTNMYEHDALPAATVNGNAAQINEGWTNATEARVYYTFTYEVQNVSNVEVSDIDTPVGNQAPDYTAALGNAGLYEFAPYGYRSAGFWWYDSEGNVLSEDDRFIKGETYMLEIKLVRRMDGQRVLTQFKTPVTATLNGKAVDSADVMANATTVYIYQTYICDTEYLIEIPAANVTVNEPVDGERPGYEAISGDSDQYTVTINSWYEDSGSGDIVGPDDVFAEGESYHVKVTFTPKDGYTFTEDTVFTINGKHTATWGRDGQEQVSFTAAENPVVTYTVTFDSAGGTAVAAQRVEAGQMAVKPADPTWRGYVFKGWTLNGSAYDFNTPVNGNITLVAVWEQKQVASGYSGYTTWVLTEDGTLIFSGEGSMKNYGYGGGQPWLQYADQITSVVIEEGITSVGSGAFMNLPALESVSLPDSMTRMGEAAFYGCAKLQSVEIPASLWTIQPYTFKNCTSLTSVTFHEGNLQKISDGAFYGTGLTELVLPDCLDILDVYTFKGCANLTSITIGSGLTELREAVFYGTAISTITIPEGITKIGPYAFKNCVALATIDLPESLKSVGEASFYACTGLKAVELPDAVTSIGNYAFRKCAAIETLTFGAELTTIGECSFYGCTGLTELVIPDKVTTIKPYAFKTCTGLTSVTLGSSVKTIGEGAFNTCTGLKTIVFPASLTSIGDYCFSGSWNLWNLTFQGSAPAIGTGAFKGMDATAYYPSGDTTWTAAVMLNYGGRITWKAR